MIKIVKKNPNNPQIKLAVVETKLDLLGNDVHSIKTDVKDIKKWITQPEKGIFAQIEKLKNNWKWVATIVGFVMGILFIFVEVVLEKLI